MEHGTPRLRARAHRPRSAAAAAAQVKAPTAAVRQCAAAIVTDMPQLENSERLSTVLKRTYCNHFGVDYDTQRQVLDYWVRKLRCSAAAIPDDPAREPLVHLVRSPNSGRRRFKLRKRHILEYHYPVLWITRPVPDDIEKLCHAVGRVYEGECHRNVIYYF